MRKCHKCRLLDIEQETNRINTILEDTEYLENLDETIEPSVELIAEIRRILNSQ